MKTYFMVMYAVFALVIMVPAIVIGNICYLLFESFKVGWKLGKKADQWYSDDVKQTNHPASS